MDIGDWKGEIKRIFNRDDRKIKFEKMPQLVKRCPKCGNLALEFDTNSGRIYCTRCGFEEHVKQVK